MLKQSQRQFLGLLFVSLFVVLVQIILAASTQLIILCVELIMLTKLEWMIVFEIVILKFVFWGVEFACDDKLSWLFCIDA